MFSIFFIKKGLRNTNKAGRLHHRHMKLGAILGVFVTSTILQSFVSVLNISSVSAVSTPTNSSLTVGTYSGSACMNGHNYKERMKTVANNILKLGYQVVGVTEYNHVDCWNHIIDELNRLDGGTWRHTKQTRKDYTVNQASILWNSKYLTITSDEIFDMDTPGNTNTNLKHHPLGNDCGGGSRYAHIARFTTRYGQSFTIANGHFLTSCKSSVAKAANFRVKEISNIIQKLKNETGAVFITGDMNATESRSIDKEFYKAVENGGYSLAIKTATEKVNDKIGTMYRHGKNEFIIDQIFYKNVAAPSYYKTVYCKSWAACGSDHRPVVAVFDNLPYGGSQGCVSEADANTKLKYSEWGIGYYGNECVCTESASGMSGNNNFEKLVTYLSSKGLSANAVAGVLGNWRVESQYSPFINQGGKGSWPSGGYGLAQWTGGRRTAVVDELKKLESFSTYYKQEYSDWAKTTDESSPDNGMPRGVDAPAEVDEWLKAEVDFMFQEIKEAAKFYTVDKISQPSLKNKLMSEISGLAKDDSVIGAMNKATTAGQAAAAFSLIFERQGALETAFSERANSAEEIIDKVKSILETSTGTVTTLSATSSGCGSDSSDDLSRISMAGLNPDELPMPKGSGHSSWKTKTLDVAKILWHLFKDDFTSFGTRTSGGFSKSCHFRGYAIDMMISNYKNAGVRKRHEEIAEWLMNHRKELNITNIIYYDKSLYGQDSAARPYAKWSAYGHPSGGTGDTVQHRDHIHISIAPCKN